MLAAAALVAAAGCGSGGSAPGPQAAGGPPATFTISGYRFPELTAAPGQTITVMDGDDEPHTVTADDGSFDSGAFDGSAPGTVTAPSTPGIYPIYCTIHPAMRGTLTVR
jgi:plastocyanin